jgi:hypothetical protein
MIDESGHLGYFSSRYWSNRDLAILVIGGQQASGGELPAELGGEGERDQAFGELARF